MKALDLRIGNFVHTRLNQQCPFRIDLFEYLEKDKGKVGMHTIIYQDPICGPMTGHPIMMYLSELHPISLTERWLMLFGFEYSYDCRIWRKDYIELSEDHTVSGDNTPRWVFHWYNTLGHQNQTVIKSVHQLQNLYYTLTGEELRILENAEVQKQY